MATTNDDALADRLRLHRNHGMRERYLHDELGSNLKPTDLAASLGLAQLRRADEGIRRRTANATRLAEALSDYMTPTVPEGRTHAWHQYTMRFPGERDAVADGLRERGIGTLAYYPVPIHRQPYLQDYVPGATSLHLPVTDRLASEVLSIPVRANLERSEVDSVIAAVKQVATPLSTLAPAAWGGRT